MKSSPGRPGDDLKTRRAGEGPPFAGVKVLHNDLILIRECATTRIVGDGPDDVFDLTGKCCDSYKQ